MNIGSTGAAGMPQADLTQQMLGGKMQEVDQAMKTAQVAAQMKVQGQEAATQQAAVAMMTGVGGKLNTVV